MAGDDLFADSAWGPPPPMPRPLWNRDTNARTHRQGNRRNLRNQSREPTQAEEEHAVHEALRSSTVKLWRDLWQQREELAALVEQLQVDLAEKEATIRKLEKLAFPKTG